MCSMTFLPGIGELAVDIAGTFLFGCGFDGPGDVRARFGMAVQVASIETRVDSANGFTA